jgi:hypothetical protein
MLLIDPRILEPADNYPYRLRSKRLGESRHDSTRQPCASSDVYHRVRRRTHDSSRLFSFKPAYVLARNAINRNTEIITTVNMMVLWRPITGMGSGEIISLYITTISQMKEQKRLIM